MSTASTQSTDASSLKGRASAGVEQLQTTLRQFLKDVNLDFRRIYGNAILGGAGGLAGWLLFSLVSEILPLEDMNTYLRDAVFGLPLGLCIGFAVGSSEGLLATRSLKRALQDGKFGALLGAAGGVIGLVLGEAVFNLVGGGVIGRAISWAFFGMFVGASDGVAHKLPLKIRYGLLGGLLGGLIGGSTYDALASLARTSASRAEATAWSSAVGLVILGACIGFMVTLVESLLRKSWLFFLTGRLEGQTRTLDSSRPHTIGSSDACSIVIPSDTSVAAVHAEFVFENDAFLVRPRDGQVIVRRDGVDQPVQAHVLAPGDRILLGGARMIFRNVEAKRKS
jgi:hypothetical protein